MDKKSQKYCYREPDFPDTAYVGVIFVGKTDNLRYIQILVQIYPTVKSLQTRVKKLRKDLLKLKEGPIYVSGLVIIKINFNKRFPLKKEYWNSKDIVPTDDLFRSKEYMKMMDDVYQFYNIMVLPAHYDVKKKEWNYINWIPVLVTTDDKKFDELSRISNQPVDSTANSIGIYSIEFVRGFDMDTGKFVKSQKEIDSEEANC